MKATPLHHLIWMLFILILTCVLLCPSVKPAQAASMVVTTTADSLTVDGLCSLREAIINANNDNLANPDCAAGSGQDTITFASGILTITPTSALPNLSDVDPLTIDGAGVVTVSGNGSYRIFTVNSGAALTLIGLTIANGNAGSNFGGAIYSEGTLIVQNSTFTGNTARFGGAILSWGGSTTIDSSTFTENSGLEGGGTLLFTNSGTHSVTNSLLFDNLCYNLSNQHGSGGGIQTENGTTVTISNVTLANNTAGGASDDGGGGLMVYGGNVTVVNSTVYGNTSASVGGGIRQLGGTVRLRNSIIASNSTGGNCTGSMTDENGNLVWGDTTCPGTNADPHLGSLADNGGATLTMALEAGSAAVNLAAPSACPAVDQRGFPRRVGYCDAGAFEAQPAEIRTNSGSPQHAIINTPFSLPLQTVVDDLFYNTLGGVLVTYSAPINGASASVSSNTATTNASGLASVTAIANNEVGTYTVAASVSGVLTPILFDLTNQQPNVTSILRAGSSPTNAASIDFIVIFNTNVTGVNVADFSPVTSGVSGAVVGAVSGSGITYTVSVSTGNGDGTLRLDLVDDDTIIDALSQPIGGPGTDNGNYSSGEVYTIDKTPPDTTLTGVPSNPTNLDYAAFTFTSPDGNASFECALDGAAFSPCTSPASYLSLAEGPHGFQVRALDSLGNTDPTPASYDWTIDLTSPDPFTVNISKSGNDVVLTWPHSDPLVHHYEVWTSAQPYFNPNDAGSTKLADVTPILSSGTFTHTAALGNVSVHHFYVVIAVDNFGLVSGISNRMGEIEFELRETVNSDFNWIALPLDASLPLASTLATNIQSNSSAGVSVATVEQWNAIGQNYQTYVKGPPSSGDYALQIGNVYRVTVDVTSGSSVIWAQLGNVPLASIYSYTLRETAGSDFNWIMLPLDKSTITQASGLKLHIDANATPATTVSTVERWNVVGQNYQTYAPPSGDFIIQIGNPYRVTVDVLSGTSSVWH